LRSLAEEAGEGFTEQVNGKGQVEVSAGSAEKFKGLMPTLDAAAYLDLPEKKRAELIDAGIVTMERLVTAERRPSVTVRL
jgi:hypothetical protein